MFPLKSNETDHDSDETEQKLEDEPSRKKTKLDAESIVPLEKKRVQGKRYNKAKTTKGMDCRSVADSVLVESDHGGSREDSKTVAREKQAEKVAHYKRQYKGERRHEIAGKVMGRREPQVNEVRDRAESDDSATEDEEEDVIESPNHLVSIDGKEIDLEGEEDFPMDGQVMIVVRDPNGSVMGFRPKFLNEDKAGLMFFMDYKKRGLSRLRNSRSRTVGFTNLQGYYKHHDSIRMRCSLDHLPTFQTAKTNRENVNHVVKWLQHGKEQKETDHCQESEQDNGSERTEDVNMEKVAAGVVSKKMLDDTRKQEERRQRKMLGEIQVKKSKKSLVVGYISDHIWPHVKFMGDEDFTGFGHHSLCAALASKCHVEEKDWPIWWCGNPRLKKSEGAGFATVTKETLASKQSNANQQMKTRYQGM